MEIVIFEELLKSVVDKLPEVQVNANISRKPSFGWGNSDSLRKFIEDKGEEHYPFIWSVPRQDSKSDSLGVFTREVELNICTRETRELANKIRIDTGYSYKEVILPIWEALCRQFSFSPICPVEDTLRWDLFPDYKLSDGRSESQEIWDVLKLTFTANYSKENAPINGA